MSKHSPVAQETVERDIDFAAVLSLVRISTTRDAADLLHSALRCAFNNGDAHGMSHMAEVIDSRLAQFERKS